MGQIEVDLRFKNVVGWITDEQRKNDLDFKSAAGKVYDEHALEFIEYVENLDGLSLEEKTRLLDYSVDQVYLFAAFSM